MHELPAAGPNRCGRLRVDGRRKDARQRTPCGNCWMEQNQFPSESPAAAGIQRQATFIIRRVIALDADAVAGIVRPSDRRIEDPDAGEEQPAGHENLDNDGF